MIETILAEYKPHDTLALCLHPQACKPAQAETHLPERDAAQCSCKVVRACRLHNTLGVAEGDLARSVACGPWPVGRQ